jgi:hypothetical protein
VSCDSLNQSLDRMAAEPTRTAPIVDATDITDRPAESPRPGMSKLGVAGAVPFIRVPVMNSSRPSPSSDMKRRGGSVPVLGEWLICSQEPEPHAPANAGVATGLHSNVRGPASLS